MDMKGLASVKVVFTVNVLIDFVGILFFVALIKATLKHKKLHGSCHLLIGVIYAVCGILSKLIIVLPYTVFSIPSIQSIPLYICIIVEFIPLFGAINIFSLMLAIGIDRLFSVYNPIWYTTRSDNPRYLLAIYAVTALHPLLCFVPFVLHRTISEPFKPTQCTTRDFFDGILLNYANIALNILTILCYILILAKVHRDKLGAQTSQARFSLLKSVALIMAIQIGGWMMTIAGFNLLTAFSDKMTPELSAILHYAMNCFSSLCSTVEVPAIYFSSTDHRQALQKEFRYFFRLFSNQIGTTNSNNMAVNIKVSGPNQRAISMQNS